MIDADCKCGGGVDSFLRTARARFARPVLSAFRKQASKQASKQAGKQKRIEDLALAFNSQMLVYSVRLHE